MKLVRGNKYRFKNQSDTPDLMYVGLDENSNWHQFTKYEEGRFGAVWCEARGKDLDLMEEVKEGSGDE